MATTRKLPSGKYQGTYRDSKGKLRSAGTFSHKKPALAAAIIQEAESRASSWRDPTASERPWGEWCAE